MNFLCGMTVAKRLLLGFGLVLLMMAGLTATGINNVNFIDKTLTEITDVNSTKQRYAINFRGSVHDRAIAIRDISITKSPEQLAELKKEIATLRAFYDNAERSMQTMLAQKDMFAAEELNILERNNRIKASTIPMVNKIIELRESGDFEAAQTAALEEARPAFVKWLGIINEFIDYQEKQNQLATPKAREVASGFTTLMLVTTFLAIAVGLGIALLISKSLKTSLGGEPFVAADTLAQITAGDLSVKVETEYENSILSSVDVLKEKLRVIVSEIASASRELQEQTNIVNAASRSADTSAQMQATLTAQTSERLQEIVASIDNISNISSQTEENSSQTQEFSVLGRKAIQESANEMQNIALTVSETVQQIQKLEANTQEIGNIVGVINGISEQTNLLALNAAIEAARAGESGRGFAVVADEVRQLAKRTSEATSQIESMIKEVQSETAASVKAMSKTEPFVESGKAKTAEATELLQKIETQAAESLQNIKRVNQATSEQLVSIKEISSAMNDVKSSSDESIHALVETTEASSKLEQLALGLNQNVSYFRL